MQSILLFLLNLAFILPLNPSAQKQEDYTAQLSALYTKILTPQGQVRYTQLRQLEQDFNMILGAIERFEAKSLKTNAEKMAFWMNAYNVLMLKNMMEEPKLTDILKKGDFFFKTPKRVAGLRLSLDQIENEILRRQTGSIANTLKPSILDPRLHVGLNCAAISCPRIRPEAFTPQNLSRLLDEGMRDFVNSPQHFRVSKDTIYLSSLLQWFGADFDQGDRKGGDFLLRYLNPKRADAALFKALWSGKTGKELAVLSSFQGKKIVYAYIWAPNRAIE